MYVTVVPNRSSPPAILLRESYRDGGKVKNRTLANLSHWPAEQIEGLRQLLRGEWRAGSPSGRRLEESFEVVRSRPHGHVAAVVGMLRRVGLGRLLASRRSRQRELCVALIAARILEPCSKLATARGFDPQTELSTLGEVLGVEATDEDELYAAMDWLLPRQGRIEEQLAQQHLGVGTFALYDVTSTYFEGGRCPLARLEVGRAHA